MKRRIGKTIDRIMNAANDVALDCLKEANILMSSNQRIEQDEDGRLVVYQNGNYTDSLNELRVLLDEIYEVKTNFNLKVNHLPEEGFAENVKSILNEVTKKHIDFIDRANNILLKLK